MTAVDNGEFLLLFSGSAAPEIGSVCSNHGRQSPAPCWSLRTRWWPLDPASFCFALTSGMLMTRPQSLLFSAEQQWKDRMRKMMAFISRMRRVTFWRISHSNSKKALRRGQLLSKHETTFVISAGFLARLYTREVFSPLQRFCILPLWMLIWIIPSIECSSMTFWRSLMCSQSPLHAFLLLNWLTRTILVG